MLNFGLHIRGAESALDRQGVRALLASQFEVRPGLGARFARLYDSLFAVDWGVAGTFSRVAVVNGEVVGHALLVQRQFWVDGTEFTGGIVAMVVVHGEFTGRGIGTALMEDVEALARRKGLLMLHLAGDPGFYTRFGYVDAYLRCSAALPALSAPKSVYDLRKAAEADIPELVRLSCEERVTGGVNPTESRWRWLLKTGHPFGLLEKNDVLLGFLAEEDFCLVLRKGAETRGFLRAAGGGSRSAT